MSRARFWWNRIFRRTFFLGIYRKVREVVLTPYAHRLLRKAAQQRGAGFVVVQAGANDGKLQDPVSKLARELGWSGVLVEPNPANFSKLQQTYRGYPQMRLEQAAITTENGTVTLFCARAMEDGSHNPLVGTDTLHPEHHEKLSWIHKDWKDLVEPIEVPAITLSSLLEKHGLTAVDFFVTDTEGHDKAILDQIDLQTLRPRFIQFEFIHLSKGDRAELCQRLRANGYRLLSLRWDVFAYLPN